jgi:RNA polymerase sigma-70 factor (ECF subfamily)
LLASRTVHATMDDRATAFAALLDRGLETHYRLAAVILGDPVEAEDAVHDAAVVAWRGFAGLRERDRFEAWFGRILVNGCRDRLRARRRRPVILAIPAFGSTDAGLPHDRIADAGADLGADFATRDQLERAFGRLEPEQAVVVALRYYADLTVPQIAARLAIPEGTVKSRLHHALRRLRVIVEAAEEVQR